MRRKFEEQKKEQTKLMNKEKRKAGRIDLFNNSNCCASITIEEVKLKIKNT